MKNKFGFAPILILVIIVIMAIALALLGHITTDGTCDYQAGWNRYPPKSCNCIGIKIMMENSLAVDGDYRAICLGYGISTPAQPTKSTNLQNDEDLQNWKTYRNEEYGFSIKYPNNWIVEQSTDYAGEVEFVGIGDENFGNLTGDYRMVIFFPKYVEQDIISVGSQFESTSARRENIEVNGLDALKVTVTTPSLAGWKSQRVYITGGQYIYAIAADLDNQTENQILSTFVFIE